MAFENQRIHGFDVARALAIVAMVVVNFDVLFDAPAIPGTWIATGIEFLYGRAAATFVMLAGISLALMTNRNRSIETGLPLGKYLVRRCALLLVVGIVLSLWWTADILHFYAMAIISLATIISSVPLIACFISPVAAFGRLSLTMYVAHLVIAGALSACLDRTHLSVTTLHVVYAAILFCCVGICFAFFWLRFFRRGPLEMLFHRFSMGLQRRPLMRLTCPGAVGEEGS